MEQRSFSTEKEQQIKLAIISPTSGLELYSTKSDLQFALAHVALKDETYRAFFKKRKQLGDYVILDNGAYELGRPMPMQQLEDLATEMQPSCLVLPDYPQDEGSKTVSASMDYLLRHFQANLDYMFVPQGLDFEDFTKTYLYGLEVTEISHIGFSRIACPALWSKTPKTWSRIRTILELVCQGKWSARKKLHALGWLGFPAELRYLAHFGFGSLDTAGPVWRGWCGFDISQEYWLDIPVDFEAELPSTEFQRQIHRNLQEVLACTY